MVWPKEGAVLPKRLVVGCVDCPNNDVLFVVPKPEEKLVAGFPNEGVWPNADVVLDPNPLPTRT